MLRPGEIAVDLFAGGGGASEGIRAALGRSPDVALNHDAVAVAVYAANHGVKPHREDVWKVRPLDATQGRPVGLLWASPDCRHHSRAKGSAPRSKSVRSLAWAVVRWCREVAPRVVMVENVVEFEEWGPLLANGERDRAKKGRTFRAWVAALRRLGYVVEWRRLDASLYGAPTRRIRLFVVARRDGEPIRWPLPTHGKELQPLRTAAECIDWSLPCPSIFGRKKALAAKTERRIALGFKRYVLDTAEPFIVETRNGEREGQAPRVRSARAPHGTVTAKGSQGALVTPYLAKLRFDSSGASLEAPMPTILAGGGTRPERPGTGNAVGLVVPYIAKVNHGRDANRSASATEPLSTVTAGQRGHALVSAWVVKHFGGVVGHACGRGLGAVTGRDHHGLAAAHLVKLRGDPSDHPTQPDLRAPCPTLSAGGTHAALVYAFVVKFFGTGIGQPCTDPLCTVTTKDRCGLVTITIDGETYVVVDIGFRMLQPHELLAAQFGEFARRYDFESVRKRNRRGRLVPLTKADKVRLIGNSVCPHVSRALVAANFPTAAEVAA